MFSIVQAAGWPIWPLLFASVLAVALIIERAFVLRREQIVPSGLVDQAIAAVRGGKTASEISIALRKRSALGRILAASVETAMIKAPGNRPAVVEAATRAGQHEAHQLEKYLNALGTIASIAPLMGLFGTVIGMIEIFGSQNAQGGTNPQQLAYGISIALYNTAFGLVVAIPAMIFWRTYRRKVDDLVVDLERESTRFVDSITPASGIAERP